jgi:uncharacterized protein YukE
MRERCDVGALDGFMSVWSAARKTFGDTTPQGGDQFDDSAQLHRLQDSVRSAAPGSGWSGAGSDAYAEANDRHGRALGAMAALDRRLGAEIDRSAAVVAAGRRDLESVKQWVTDAASKVPRTTAGERVLWPVVSKGANDIADIIQRSHSDLSAIAGRIRRLGSDYLELYRRNGDGDVAPVDFQGDGDERDVPETTLDLADIEYLAPGAKGKPGMQELVPGSGVWVPDPSSPTYRPKRPEAPLDLNDIEYLGPGVKGQPWQMELVPGSGAWVPDPNYPGYQPSVPQAPVDLGELETVDPNALVPADKVELWPHAGVLIPNPYLGRPF